MVREHSTEGKAAQALDGRTRKARRRADAVPPADNWAVHLGRYDAYLWNAQKMVAVELDDLNYYLTRHPGLRVTAHPHARFALRHSQMGDTVVALSPPVSLADIRK